MFKFNDLMKCFVLEKSTQTTVGTVTVATTQQSAPLWLDQHPLHTTVFINWDAVHLCVTL